MYTVTYAIIVELKSNQHFLVFGVAISKLQPQHDWQLTKSVDNWVNKLYIFTVHTTQLLTDRMDKTMFSFLVIIFGYMHTIMIPLFTALS